MYGLFALQLGNTVLTAQEARTHAHSVHTFYSRIFKVITIVSMNKIHYLCGHIIITVVVTIITIVFIIATKAILALKLREVKRKGRYKNLVVIPVLAISNILLSRHSFRP
jgi:uncharacterized membrane protein YhaH (DUF805 family)